MKSEGAQLMARINAEIEAHQRELSGLSQGTAMHEMIITKMTEAADYLHT